MMFHHEGLQLQPKSLKNLMSIFNFWFQIRNLIKLHNIVEVLKNFVMSRVPPFGWSLWCARHRAHLVYVSGGSK